MKHLDLKIADCLRCPYHRTTTARSFRAAVRLDCAVRNFTVGVYGPDDWRAFSNNEGSLPIPDHCPLEDAK